jgi:hypothetical protein
MQAAVESARKETTTENLARQAESQPQQAGQAPEALLLRMPGKDLTAALKRAPSAARPVLAQSVLRLQRQFGNRCLQRAFAEPERTREGNPEGETEGAFDRRDIGPSFSAPPEPPPAGSVPGRSGIIQRREEAGNRLKEEDLALTAPRGATPQASPEHQLGSLAGSQQAAGWRPEYSSRLPDDGGRQILALQRAAGNAVAGQAVRALQREPVASEVPPVDATGAPVLDAGPAAGTGLSDEDRRKLDYARTTLAKVKPLAKDDEAVLLKLLAGSPIHELIERRNVVRDNLVRLVMTGEDEELKRSSEIGGKTYWDRLGELSTQLQQLEGGIGGALKAIGVADECELKNLISDRFPTLFLKRAEEIALTLLDQNAAVARAEAPRFGLLPDQVGAGAGAEATINERMSITEPGGPRRRRRG